MDLELLKRFYIVAQEGTMWRAADRIHVAQSAQDLLIFLSIK